MVERWLTCCFFRLCASLAPKSKNIAKSVHVLRVYKHSSLRSIFKHISAADLNVASLALVWKRIWARPASRFFGKPLSISYSRSRSTPSLINSNSDLVAKVADGFVE